MDWDTVFFHTIRGFAGKWESLDWVMIALSREGHLLFPIVVLVGYWLWNNWREAILAGPMLAGVIGISDFIGGQLKLFIARPRPCHVFVNIPELVGCGGTFSLPSNHAINSAAAAAFLSFLYPSTGWVAWPLVGLIGLSRVYLGAHYLSDVVGGWAIGSMIGLGFAFVLSRWVRFRSYP